MSVESPFRSGADRPFGLIETLRFEPGHGCVRIDRHLARLADSALHFGKKFDHTNAMQKLGAIESDECLRVRLFLDTLDGLTVTTHPFVPVSHGRVWTIAIAEVKLDRTNTLLAHKTSLRDVYDTARSEFDTSIIDEVLLTNQHGHMCEGTITNLFVQKGDILVTPPLQDGLLRGVFRQELLDTGKVIEEPVVPEDLNRHAFFVGNSLRGLIPARLMLD